MMKADIRYWRGPLSLGAIARRYPAMMSVTWPLLLGEALLDLALPLVIGLAVDDFKQSGLYGLWPLAAVCLAMLLVGAGRRFYDSRAYARLYRDLANSLTARKEEGRAGVSRLSGRLRLLQEVTEFFEADLPELLNALVGFAGIMLILGLSDARLLGFAGAAFLVIVLIYSLSGRRLYRLNRAQNNELERQVTALETGRKSTIGLHIHRLMRWNIRLSDLEVVNFSGVWLALAAFLIGSIVIVTTDNSMSHGQSLATIMYVLQLVELIMLFPALLEKFIRLKEITRRISPDHTDLAKQADPRSTP